MLLHHEFTAFTPSYNLHSHRSLGYSNVMCRYQCLLENIYHTAAIGGVLGGLIAFSFMLNFNPIWWLCLVIIASGIVGSSRIILRQHSLIQVTMGFFLGTISAFITILLV